MSVHIEDLVAEFVQLRDTEPDLSAEDFASRHPEHRAALLAALQRALGVLEMLPTAGAMPAAIGPYAVRREIGRGATSLVYEVDRDGRRAALKLLATVPLLGERSLERFRREVETLRGLHHEGIVSVLDTGTHQGMPYLVLELVAGPSLAERTGRLDRAAAVLLVRRVAEALSEAHARGIHHRDLKPQNIVLRPDGSPVIVDFGLVAAPGQATLTGTGDVLGTPLYMAPEQALGGETDARADVFALGLVLYELLAGRPARALQEAGVSAGVAQRVASAAGARIPRLHRLLPDLPAPLDRILRVALAERPAWRYASARPFAEDLARFERGEEPLARPPGRLARGIYWLARRPAASVAIGGAACVLGLVVAWSPWRRPPPPSPVELAERSLAARDYESAIGHLETAASSRPAVAETWLSLARACYLGSRWERGLQAVERALVLGHEDPPAAAALNLKASLLDALGRHDAAQDVFRGLCARYPDDTNYPFNLARSLDAANQVREAHATYAELLARNPKHARATACLAWLLATARGEFADLRDEARAEELSLALLALDRGRSETMVRTVVDVARTTGRSARVVTAMEEIAARPDVPPGAAARLQAEAKSLRHSADKVGK